MSRTTEIKGRKVSIKGDPKGKSFSTSIDGTKIGDYKTEDEALGAAEVYILGKRVSQKA